ncbi:PTS cellbiose transporter subunit IIC [Enterococcus hirae]|nr:PTS cellbiose transporter subunit IIC [Enterococcus hirae]
MVCTRAISPLHRPAPKDAGFLISCSSHIPFATFAHL